MTSRGSFSLLNKKTGEVLKEPPKSWGYADPAFKNSRTTAKSVFETEGFASLLSYLVERPEVVGGVDKVRRVCEGGRGASEENAPPRAGLQHACRTVATPTTTTFLTLMQTYFFATRFARRRSTKCWRGGRGGRLNS